LFTHGWDLEDRALGTPYCPALSYVRTKSQATGVIRANPHSGDQLILEINAFHPLDAVLPNIEPLRLDCKPREIPETGQVLPRARVIPNTQAVKVPK
jgi:hypothetical protein